MSLPLLPNYIRANRKRIALSQGDMAFLLGNQSGGVISRLEQFTRKPTLESALAFEVIFKRSVSEIFPGLYEKAEKNVSERAKALAGRTPRKSTRLDLRKYETLTSLADIQK